jgi:hypothetical protein
MAKGSHTTRGGWEPRTCCLCGGKVTPSRNKPTDHYSFSRFGGPGRTPFAKHMAGCPK